METVYWSEGRAVWFDFLVCTETAFKVNTDKINILYLKNFFLKIKWSFLFFSNEKENNPICLTSELCTALFCMHITWLHACCYGSLGENVLTFDKSAKCSIDCLVTFVVVVYFSRLDITLPSPRCVRWWCQYQSPSMSWVSMSSVSMSASIHIIPQTWQNITKEAQC